MEKFNRTLRGYDPIEVNQFLDQVIRQVERMVNDIKVKDARIAELEVMEEENILDGLQVEIIPSGEGEEEDDEFIPGAW